VFVCPCPNYHLTRHWYPLWFLKLIAKKQKGRWFHILIRKKKNRNSKVVLKIMSRRNKIIKDSFKLKIIKRPYSKDENSTVLERVGFPQRNMKNKKNLARISFYVKKKFERQFQEHDVSFVDYISKSHSKSQSSLTQSHIKVNPFTPAPELDNSNYKVDSENWYTDIRSGETRTHQSSRATTTANINSFLGRSKSAFNIFRGDETSQSIYHD